MNQTNQILNSGFKWYQNNLKSASSSIQSQIDNLIKMKHPTTIKEITQIVINNSQEIKTHTRDLLKKLKKTDLIELSKDFKISVNPTTKKSKIIAQLLNKPLRSINILKSTDRFNKNLYDDPCVKALALLKLQDIADKNQLLLSHQKLPKHIQQAINTTNKYADKALKSYLNQVGGAIETVPIITGMSPIIIGTAIGGLLLITIIALGLFRWFKQPNSVTRAMNEYSFNMLNRYPAPAQQCIRCQQCKIIPKPFINSDTRTQALQKYSSLIKQINSDMCGACVNCTCSEGCPDYLAIINENNNNLRALAQDNANIAIQEQQRGYDLDFYRI